MIERNTRSATGAPSVAGADGMSIVENVAMSTATPSSATAKSSWCRPRTGRQALFGHGDVDLDAGDVGLQRGSRALKLLWREQEQGGGDERFQHDLEGL